jgi:GNAT superfamily N-acetyltransferase
VIEYRPGKFEDVDAAIDLYIDSTLGARRPVDDRARMAAMLENANLTVTAWDGDRLVGIARSVTDFAFCTYLSDLCVRKSYQRQGIGQRLIEETQSAAPQATVILLSAPAAVEYYPHVGMKQHPSAWTLAAADRLRSR